MFFVIGVRVVVVADLFDLDFYVRVDKLAQERFHLARDGFLAPEAKDLGDHRYTRFGKRSLKSRFQLCLSGSAVCSTIWDIYFGASAGMSRASNPSLASIYRS